MRGHLKPILEAGGLPGVCLIHDNEPIEMAQGWTGEVLARMVGGGLWGALFGGSV